MKTERIFQGLKGPGSGADHSFASNIEINPACESMQTVITSSWFDT